MTIKAKPAGRSRSRASAASVGDLMQLISGALTVKAAGVQADPIQGNSDVLAAQWREQFAGEDITAMTLGLRMRRIAMLIDEACIRECEPLGLKLNELLLLMALRRVGAPYELRPTDILKMHSVTSGTATYRIDQLTKQELAVRIPDPTDRRGYLVRLTPRGLKMVDAVLHRLLHNFRADLQPMSAIPGAVEVLEEMLRLYERCISKP